LQDGVAPKLMSRERDGWYQLLSRRAARQADPTAFDLKGLGGLIEERATDETRLPQHVVDRIDRRFTSCLAQMLEGRRRERTSVAPSRDADAAGIARATAA
jgi:hypothetical protein